MSAVRARLAFVGPLPPVRSGIADYARDLLPHVARDFDVEVFVDDRHPLVPGGRYGDLPLRPASELRGRHGEFHHVVYQLGNNLHHRFVLELAGELPGVVVLHDLVLHHLYEEIAGLEDEWERYGEVLREAYGAIGGEVLRWKRWRLASERENFALPLFEPVASASRGVLVHSHTAAAEVRRRLPGMAVARIPMGVPPEPALDREAARRRLGVPAEHVLVGAFGFLTPIKRIDVLGRALRVARAECPDLRLVLVGEASPGLRLDEMFSPEEIADGRVVHRGYVSAQEYRDWTAATDVAVNLRYPSAGESSASLLRLLAGGKCALVSAYRQFLEIPPDAVARVPLGDEEPTLVRELVALARDPERRARIGAAAHAFVAADHSMEAAAAGFRSALEALAAGASRPPRATSRRPTPTSRASAVAGRASAAIAGDGAARPGASIEIELRVRNEGTCRWVSTPEPAGGHVGVAVEIRSARGRVVGRARPQLLPHDLERNEETTLRLRVDAPLEPGEYSIVPLIVHFGRRATLAAGESIPLAVRCEAA